MDSLEQTRLTVQALVAKKALDIVVLDLQGLTIIADHFVIATGTSAPHVHALVDAVLDAMRAQQIKGITPEGLDDLGWVLIDLGDVVVHIFNAEMRDFYQLERLWADAPRLPLPAESDT